jgi:amino acid transporter
VFAGAWVAGRLAGMPDRTDGMLHGLVTWGLAMLLLIYLLTTAVSSLVGGAFGIVGSAMQTAGQGAHAAAGVTQQPGLLGPFQQDIQQLLGRARQQAQQAGQQIEQIASDENVRSVVQKAVTAGPESLSEADRQAAINVLVQHTGMTRPEAEQWLAQWQQTYRQAAQAAEATADTVSRASLWSFAALLLGAIVAAVGGMLGAPRKVSYAKT